MEQFEIGQTLAAGPGGHRAVAYQQDGQWWTALYCHGGFVRPHPDHGWTVPDFNGKSGPKLTWADLAALAQLAPTGDMPPLIGWQHGLVIDGTPPWPNEPDDTPPADFFVDWEAFWAAERDDRQWLYEPILARGRGHAIYAAHKVGKSLAALDIALRLATSPQPVTVIYLDYEMGPDDLQERLIDMGHGPDSDLERLRYALIPALPPLDTAQGADALLHILDAEQANRPDHHHLVVIDTTARALTGDENSADTVRAFYRHTGSALKRRQVTWARLDHAGKDPAKGQRGSSAKGDDVDVVWKVTPADRGGLRFTREASRIAWIPDTVDLHRHDDPFRLEPGPRLWPTGTAEKADILDKLGAPLDIRVADARALLVDHGETAGRNAYLAAAIRYRRDRYNPLHLLPGNDR